MVFGVSATTLAIVGAAAIGVGFIAQATGAGKGLGQLGVGIGEFLFEPIRAGARGVTEVTGAVSTGVTDIAQAGAVLTESIQKLFGTIRPVGEVSPTAGCRAVFGGGEQCNEDEDFVRGGLFGVEPFCCPSGGEDSQTRDGARNGGEAELFGITNGGITEPSAAQIACEASTCRDGSRPVFIAPDRCIC